MNSSEVCISSGVVWSLSFSGFLVPAGFRMIRGSGSCKVDYANRKVQGDAMRLIPCPLALL